VSNASVLDQARKDTVLSDQLLTTKQAAALLGMSTAFLERDRWAGARIPFIKIGSRAVRYRPEDLRQYVESRRAHSTSKTFS